MVEQLIGRDRNEVHQHDFGNGSHARDRGTHGGAHDGLLADRRAPHAIRTVLGLQTLVYTEAAALGILDVFAELEDAGVNAERDVECIAYGVDHHHRAGCGGGAHYAISWA
jgi:hypothetical protein